MDNKEVATELAKFEAITDSEFIALAIDNFSSHAA